MRRKRSERKKGEQNNRSCDNEKMFKSFNQVTERKHKQTIEEPGKPQTRTSDASKVKRGASSSPPLMLLHVSVPTFFSVDFFKRHSWICNDSQFFQSFQPFYKILSKRGNVATRESTMFSMGGGGVFLHEGGLFVQLICSHLRRLPVGFLLKIV